MITLGSWPLIDAMSDHQYVPFVGTNVKLGKLPPKIDSRTLQLASYKTAALPTPPKTYAAANKVSSFPMFANDEFGDCTCAAVAHQEEVWTSYTKLYTPTTQEVLDFYFLHTPPCAPGGPGDTGRVELDVLNDWKNIGFGANKHKIAGYAAVNVHDVTEVKQAIWLFGGLYIGIALPITAQSQRKWKLVNGGYDSEPGSWGGHAVNVVAYTGDSVTVATWGQRLQMTWGFWQEYVDEAYAVLSSEWAAATSPTGFNFTQLQSDLSSI